MIDHGRHLDDDALGGLLTTLGSGLAWPSADERVPDIATRVRVAIAASAMEPRARSGGPGSWRRARRAVLLAVAALLALAAVAGAVGLGLPGLRLILAEPSATPSSEPSNGTPGGSTSPLPSAPGERLGLGTLVTLAEADDQVDRSIPVPTDPAVGPPDAVFVDLARGGQVALVWAARPGLPETLAPGVGMILMSYDGALFAGTTRRSSAAALPWSGWPSTATVGSGSLATRTSSSTKARVARSSKTLVDGSAMR